MVLKPTMKNFTDSLTYSDAFFMDYLLPVESQPLRLRLRYQLVSKISKMSNNTIQEQIAFHSYLSLQEAFTSNCLICVFQTL